MQGYWDDKERTDDRYELLMKFQSILKTLGFRGVIVLVDRLDEPHLINGAPELMKALLWPMLDNKFLKHPGLGLKIMAPVELTLFIDRENREFYERARLDKQNMVSPFQWTAEALSDVANARLAACTPADSDRQPATVRDFIDAAVSDQRMAEALRSLRTPRHLFKFLHQLFATHCGAHVETAPVWQVSSETFETTLAIYKREQAVFEASPSGAG